VCHNRAALPASYFHNRFIADGSGEESLLTAIAQPGRWVHKNNSQVVERLAGAAVECLRNRRC
jgi:hypothetical protein